MATARFTRTRVLPFVVVTAALAAVIAPAATSSAEPQLTLSQVEARVAALDDQAQRIIEAYDGTHDKLTALQRQQKIAGDRLAREQKALAAVQARIAATADAAYRSGGLDQFSIMTTSDPQSFLDQAVVLDEVARTQAEQLADVASADHAVAVARTQYAEQAAAVRQTLAGLAADKQRIDRLLAQERALLASLRAADRARLAAQQANEVASQVAMRGSYHGPASGQAGVAVRFAYAQLGKPYQYGAAGPGSYDCSGLTMAAWAAAGVSLPHNAAAQQSATRPVAYGDLQPGDLTFFGSPAYHVAIYIGGGRVIEAPHTGDVVKIVSLSSMPDYSGAGRP